MLNFIKSYHPPVNIIVISMLFLFSLPGCFRLPGNAAYDTRYKIGRGWVTGKGEEVVEFDLVLENKTLSFSKGGGKDQVRYQTTLYMQTLDVKTGEVMGSKKLADITKLADKTVKLIAGRGEEAWCYIDGLSAYNIYTFEKVADQSMLETKNPGMQGAWPATADACTWNIYTKQLQWIGMNGTVYAMDLETRQISVCSSVACGDLSNISKQVYKANQSLNTLFDLSVADITIYADTSGQACYGLMSDQEIKSSRLNMGSSGNPDVRRKIYRSVFEKEKYGEGVLLKETTPLSEKSYLGGAFLTDLQTGYAYRTLSPAGYIILHKDILGPQGKYMLTRIDDTGKETWTCLLSLSVITDYHFTKNYLVITGENGNKLVPGAADTFISIALHDGKMVTGSYTKK